MQTLLRALLLRLRRDKEPGLAKLARPNQFSETESDGDGDPDPATVLSGGDHVKMLAVAALRK